MTTFLTILGLATVAGTVLGGIVGELAADTQDTREDAEINRLTAPLPAEGELTGEQPVVAPSRGRHCVESVEARLSGGADRLEDTATMRPIIDDTAEVA